MSLTGNLEDLPLLDIIQIVSFSKKTGYLTIRTSQGEAAIVFQDGSVVSSFTWDSLPLDPRAASLAKDKRAKLIRSRIEIALEQLIRLREGQFSFSLTDQPPKAIGSRNIADEHLEGGINPQELLLDLARGMDEDRRDSAAALEASFAEPPEEPYEEEAAGDETVAAYVREATGAAETEAAPAPPPQEEPELAPIDLPPPGPEAAGGPSPEDLLGVGPAPAAAAPPAAPEAIRSVLLVDDEEDVRRVLAERIAQGGFEVVDAFDPDSAVKKAGALGKAGTRFILLTDLGMPTSGGASFQGGFEVVKRLWKMNLRPPVLMMADSLSPALQARARQMGVSGFVFKPGLSKLDPEQFSADLKAFAGKVVSDILPKLARAAPAPGGGAGPAPAARKGAARPAQDEISKELRALQQRLEELRRPKDATQISALVMKVAREFFERGILFLVKDEEVRGLGGFGPAPKGESLNLLVREVVIPLAEPSIFQEVVAGRKSFAGAAEGKWPASLLGKIGRFKSGTVALLPLLAHRETIALLYGDNPETGRDFGRLDTLEVFINQSGIALENAFLQRKIEAMQPRE